MSVSTLRYGISPSVGNKFLKMMLLTGIPFGLFMGIFWSFQYGAKSGVVMGSRSWRALWSIDGCFCWLSKEEI